MYNLHIQKHPFRTDVEYFEVDNGVSLEDAYMQTNPVLPIEHARMMVNDEIVSDYTYIPKEDDLVTIKVVPAGEDGIKTTSTIGMVLGVVVMLAGFATAFIPGLQGAAPFLIKSGAGIFVTGWGIGLAGELMKLSQFDSEDSRKDIHGSSAGTSRWTPVPLVYGEHYLAPSLASSDWTDLEVDPNDSSMNNVILHQLYILGDQNPDWNTRTIVDNISIGDSQLFESVEMKLTGYIKRDSDTQATIHLTSSLTPTFSNFITFMGNSDSTQLSGMRLSIQGHTRPQNNRDFPITSFSVNGIVLATDKYIADDTSSQTLTLKYMRNSGVYRGVDVMLIEDGDFASSPYPKIVYESYIGKELSSAATFPTYYTTPDNVRAVNVVITCPQGLYKGSSNKKKTGVKVEVRAKRIRPNDTGTDDWETPRTISIPPQNTNQPRRKDLLITFNTPGQWLLEFRKTTDDFTSADEGVNTTYIDRVTCTRTKKTIYMGEYASHPANPSRYWLYKNTTANKYYYYDGTIWEEYVSADFDLAPVHDEIKTKFSYLAMKIIASEQLNGSINNLNCILRHEVHAYDSVDEKWYPAYSNNPAAIFVDTLLNPNRNRYPLVPSVNWSDLSNVPIDWAAIENWYTYCEDNSLSCNGVVASSSTVKQELEKIALTGRANFTMKDGKYSVIIDEPRPTVQLFTPRNTHSFSATRTFHTRPDGVRVKFVNKDIGYQSDEIRIEFSNSSETTFDELNLEYITDASQAFDFGKYYLNVKELRQETFTFSTDFEYLVCTAGDRIKFQHDVPLLGMVATRVVAVKESGGQILSLIVDETINMEAGETYAIELRVVNEYNEFELKTLPVANAEIATNEITLSTPQPLGSIARGDLLAFGKSSLVTEDLIIAEINCSDDLSASLTCIPYSEEVYDISSYMEREANIGLPASAPRVARVEDATSRGLQSLSSQVLEARGNKIFNETQPTPPYRVGDVWKRGINMYVTDTARTATDIFREDDWILATSDTFQAVSSEMFKEDYPEHRWYMAPNAEYPMLEVHGFIVNDEDPAHPKENVLDDDRDDANSYWTTLEETVGILTVPDPKGSGYRIRTVTAITAENQTSYIAGRWGRNAWHGQAFTNLIVSPDAPSTQNVVITAGNYVLQTYAGTVTCSYGSATKENLLYFTSTGETLNIVMTDARYVSLTETDFIPPYVVGTFTGNYNSYAMTVPTVSGIALVYNRTSTFANIIQLYVDANNYIALGIIEDALRVIRRGGGVYEYHDYPVDDYAPRGELSFTITYNHATQTVEVKFGNEDIQVITSWVFGYTSGDDEIVFGYQLGDDDIIFGQGTYMEDTPTMLYVGCLHDLSSYANNEIHMIEVQT